MRVRSVDAEPSFLVQLAEVRQGRRDSILVESETVSDPMFAQLAEVASQLRILTVEQGDFTTTQLRRFVDSRPMLQRLKLGGPVGDEHLRLFAQIPSLRLLNLPDGEFTDAGLAELKSLTQLELLRIHSSRVTDQGMREIAQLPALRFLHLINTPISDASLKAIAGMETLESFYLDGSKCSEAGLSQLVKQRPDLHFHWNDLHLPSDAAAHSH